MTTRRTVTIWDFLTMGVWSILFVIGLVPELVFHQLRSTAAVSASGSLVNSSSVITLSFAAYLAFFVLRQCKAAGLDAPNAQGRAVQAALWSLIAFLEIPTRSPVFGTQTLLGIFLNSPALPSLELKVIIWAVSACKLIAWSYLFALMFRFHLRGDREAFNGIRMIVPTSHAQHPEPAPVEEDEDEPNTKQNAERMEP